jgi:uncharacterized protein (TIGR02118 family)
MFQKRSDLRAEEFRSYWKGTHASIAAKMPGLRKYIQDHVIPDPSLGAPPYDAVAELWFDSVEAFHASLASPEGQATLADGPNYSDGDSVRVMIVEEVVIV